MQAKVAAQRIRNAALEEDIESDDKEGKMARAARDRLGLVNPGELIIVDMTP
jgi:cell division protein FtsB